MCDVDDDGYTLDMITFEPVKGNNLVSIGEGERRRCYDINTLINLPNDPFTRQEWPPNVKALIRRYLRRVIPWMVTPLAPLPEFTISGQRDLFLGDAIVHVANKLKQPFYSFNGLVKLPEGYVNVNELDFNQRLVDLGVDMRRPFVQLKHNDLANPMRAEHFYRVILQWVAYLRRYNSARSRSLLAQIPARYVHT